MYKVLLVEDEDIIRKGLMFIADWKSADCIVVGEAVDGLDGLEKIEELRPDIVIVDINMPIKDGLAMLEESINKYSYDAVVVSGYSEFEYAKKAISLGVSEYILKPINYDELFSAIRKIISKKNIYKELQDQKNILDIEKKKLSILPEGLEQTVISSDMNKYVKIMLEYIEGNFSKKISITDISNMHNISCTYLNSNFKEETGYTFNDFLNRYRMKKAVDLLKEDKFMVYEIADKVGIYDYKYFIKVFKKYIGCSPMQFMKEFKK